MGLQCQNGCAFILLVLPFGMSSSNNIPTKHAATISTDKQPFLVQQQGPNHCLSMMVCAQMLEVHSLLGFHATIPSTTEQHFARGLQDDSMGAMCFRVLIGSHFDNLAVPFTFQDKLHNVTERAYGGHSQAIGCCPLRA